MLKNFVLEFVLKMITPFIPFSVLERDSKLTELDTRADALQAGAAQFETNATSLQRKFWWQNMKMNLIIGGVIIIGKFYPYK